MENILDEELSKNLKLKDLIVYYHQIRPVLKYSEICHIICTIHNRSISVKQLKYFCQKLKLTRRRHVQDDLVKDIISNELSTSRSCLGYRQLSEFINIKYSLTVSKEQVRKCLKVVDPEGVKERWRKVIKRRITKLMDLETRISLHKTSFYTYKKNKILYAYRCTKQIPDPKICRNGEILRINDFRSKMTRPLFYQE